MVKHKGYKVIYQPTKKQQAYILKHQVLHKLIELEINVQL
jgi:hypothetical protein